MNTGTIVMLLIWIGLLHRTSVADSNGESLVSVRPRDELLQEQTDDTYDNEVDMEWVLDGDIDDDMLSLMSSSDHKAKHDRKERKIIDSIQVGISVAVRGFKPVPESGDWLSKDSETIDTILLAAEPDESSPSNEFDEFEFKTVAPSIYQHFRDMFGVETKDYLASIGNKETPLRRVGSSGASGSRFYLTHDSRFIIKTLLRQEIPYLAKILPQYYASMKQNHEQTLLPKLYGQHCYASKELKESCFIIMNNLLPADIEIHQKYDLKGAKLNRRASDKERAQPLPTFRDLDFLEQHEHGFILEADLYDSLMEAIASDLKFLADLNIMDYSLLVGVHKLDSDQTAPIMSTLQKIDNNWGPILATNHKGERMLLFIGIIDILQVFRLMRNIEHAYKSMLHDRDTVSVQKPPFYSKRLREFLATMVFRRSFLADKPDNATVAGADDGMQTEDEIVG